MSTRAMLAQFKNHELTAVAPIISPFTTVNMNATAAGYSAGRETRNESEEIHDDGTGKHGPLMRRRNQLRSNWRR